MKLKISGIAVDLAKSLLSAYKGLKQDNTDPELQTFLARLLSAYKGLKLIEKLCFSSPPPMFIKCL